MRLNIRAREQSLSAICGVGLETKSLKKLPKDWESATFSTFKGESRGVRGWLWAVSCVFSCQPQLWAAVHILNA